MVKAVAVILVVLLVGALSTFWFACPCEQMPGGPLQGERSTATVQNWSFANEPGLCQVQVDRGIPWSVNLNCMSVDEDLYISCARCDGKGWSTAVLDNPEGFIRIRQTVYPVTFTRLADSKALDAAWRARLAKLGADESTLRPAHWWSFRLVSRPT